MYILLGNFLDALAMLLDSVLTIVIFLCVARAILSWVSPDPSNPIVQFITNATEPILSKAREKIPPVGMMDVSVIVVILLLYFLKAFLVRSMQTYAQMCLQAI